MILVNLFAMSQQRMDFNKVIKTVLLFALIILRLLMIMMVVVIMPVMLIVFVNVRKRVIVVVGNAVMRQYTGVNK